MTRSTDLVLALLTVGAGLALLVRGLRPRALAIAGVLERPRVRIRAQQLGLATRLLARFLRAPHPPCDEDFALLELYAVDVDVRPVFATPAGTWIYAAAQTAAPLLELERLLEALDRLGARVRRVGRRHERG